MIRKVAFLFLIIASLSWSLDAFSALPFLKLFIAREHKNCPEARATSHPKFCESFVAAASCRCVAAGLPAGRCNNMDDIYSRMITIFGSQYKACDYQKDTSTQICMDDWNCYRLGGKDSRGNKCSGTGKSCR